jgi:hypothetical protein
LQNQTAERNYEMFEAFSDFFKEAGDFDAKGEAEIITDHLKALLTTFETYCPEHEDPLKQNMLIINPFIEHKGTSLPYEELEEHIELSSDKELEMLFKSTSASQFWIKVKTEYSKLHVRAVKFPLCFSNTYLCEPALSAMTLLKIKQ